MAFLYALLEKKTPDMFNKGSKLYSILFLKCPKCHDSDLFIEKRIYKVAGYFDMPKSCPKCQQGLSLEPGFYYGAMYVSYATSIAWLTVIYFSLVIFYPEFSLEFYLITGLLSLICLSPYLFRLSRSIWINLFIHYEENIL